MDAPIFSFSEFVLLVGTSSRVELEGQNPIPVVFGDKHNSILLLNASL